MLNADSTRSTRKRVASVHRRDYFSRGSHLVFVGALYSEKRKKTDMLLRFITRRAPVSFVWCLFLF